MPTASHSIPRSEDGQPIPQSWIVEPQFNYRPWLQTCPNAQTLLAELPDFRATLVIPLPCKQWSCRHCAQNKCRQLARRTADAKPNRMLTLTVDPKLWSSPREAFDGTRRQIPPFMAVLRSRFGTVEYLRVTEITKSGWPHYHFLLRSDFIPHAVARNQWQQLTGATIVDLRQVKDHWNAYSYLLKYLCKLHRIEWTERHVSTSRGFFADPEPKPDWPFELHDTANQSIHPNTYLTRFEAGAYCARVSSSVFAVANSLDSLQGVVDVYNSERAKRPGADHAAV